jgi:hypothetical protein
LPPFETFCLPSKARRFTGPKGGLRFEGRLASLRDDRLPSRRSTQSENSAQPAESRFPEKSIPPPSPPQKRPPRGMTSRRRSNLLDVLRGHREQCRWTTRVDSRDRFARLTPGLEAPRFYGVRPCDRPLDANRAQARCSCVSPIFMRLGAARSRRDG